MFTLCSYIDGDTGRNCVKIYNIHSGDDEDYGSKNFKVNP